MKIETYFHPIISIKHRSIVALEALSRFKVDEDDSFKPINLYMETLNTEEDLLSLDLQLIETAAKNFSAQATDLTDLLLFLNVSSSLVNRGEYGIFKITKILSKTGISPKRVVLEILEENLEDSTDCNSFFISARESGYSLALDDVGVGFSNLQRIAQVKPDVIKLDISLISNLHQDYYKRKVFRSLTKLAHDIGALVVAEGVETKEETLKSLELGAGLLQGFHFCKPNPSISYIMKICNPIIENCRVDLKYFLKKQKEIMRKIKKDHMQNVQSLSMKLSHTKLANFENELTKCINEQYDIECIFIMDSEGIQITETLTNNQKVIPKNFLFKPAEKGADHSLKPYYMDSDTISECHVTDKYISQATGQPCRTFSGHFYNNGDLYILCVDYNKKLSIHDTSIAI